MAITKDNHTQVTQETHAAAPKTRAEQTQTAQASAEQTSNTQQTKAELETAPTVKTPEPVINTSTRAFEARAYELVRERLAANPRYARMVRKADGITWRTWLTGPVIGVLVVALLLVGLVGYGLGSALSGSTPNGSTGTAAASNSSGSSMAGMGSSGSTTSTSTNVPNATASFGNQEAKYTIDTDGAKHFNFTAKQVMWEVTKGHRLLAWTLDGTVPGPLIRVTAGDHVRITINNQFPEPTAIHWHGLDVPTAQDGVPGAGGMLIQPGKSFTYDFSVSDLDVGTHWWHSHYDDLTQMGNGLFGGFIVDPRPGSAQAQSAVHADVTIDDYLSEMGGYFLISGKAFPDTQPIQVKHGQTVLIRLYGADIMMVHPMHLHGDAFNIVAEDGHTLAQPITKDTVLVSPGESYDIVFQANEPPGSVYPFHCHILTHLMNPGQSGTEMGGLVQLVKYAK